MRQIEEAMLEAVKTQSNWKSGNTEVENIDGVSHVYLHHNLIAVCTILGGKFTLKGHNTQTTRSRLRALGVDLTCRNFLPVFNGSVISSTEWYSFTAKNERK